MRAMRGAAARAGVKLVPHRLLYSRCTPAAPHHAASTSYAVQSSHRRAACARACRPPGCCRAAPAQPGPSAAQEQAAISIAGSEGLEDVIQLLQGAAAQGAQLAPEAAAGLERAVPAGSLPSLPPRSLARLMASIAGASGAVLQAWQDAALASAEAHMAACAPEDTTPLAELLWATCELGWQPSPQWLGTAGQAVARSVADGSFLAPQFSTCLCALGAMGHQPDKAWLDAMTKEAELQLAQFTSDFAPADIARLALGLADLKAEISSDCSSALMKAVYMRVRTIEDKGAVDYALARLNSEERSMAYDPRWNHEELSMLPNRVKDKRRIMSEGWFRTKWGGWSPGGK